MLETLDDIDWPRLQHAYGKADDVPELIRALAADDRRRPEKPALGKRLLVKVCVGEQLVGGGR